MKLVSKISLNEDEQEVINGFVYFLNTICSNRTDCSDCPIFKACKYQGNLPEALNLLLSQTLSQKTLDK